MLVWEYILPGEVRRRPLQDLVLHLQTPLVTAKLNKLLLLTGGQPRVATAIVGELYRDPNSGL